MDLLKPFKLNTNRSKKSIRSQEVKKLFTQEFIDDEANQFQSLIYENKVNYNRHDVQIEKEQIAESHPNDLNSGDKVNVEKNIERSQQFGVGDDNASSKTDKNKKFSIDYNGVKRDDNDPEKMDFTFTGYFKDGIKRIDMVLVIQDDGDHDAERLKINFFMSAVKAGLELEMDPGLMDNHQNLIFVKIHAPDVIIEEYGQYFRVKKYFKDSHVEFVKPQRTVLERFFPGISIKYEKEWIKLVRESYRPLEYSNSERSSIVLKILYQLQFDIHEYHYGLNRLIHKNIILDAYALHDGPYFFLPNQDMSKVNARQILFYTWTGRRNCYRLQPLDLIHEYLGDRVGFYFAFFAFYNHGLTIAGVVGILTLFLEAFDTSDNAIVEEACGDNVTSVCPTCRRFEACPFLKLSDYCFMTKLINYIDNPYTFLYCLFIAIWAIMVVAFWKRKEHYWSWMWELNEYEMKNTIRPDFNVDLNNFKRSQLTGIIKNFESPKKRVLRILMTSLALFFTMCTVMLVITTLVAFKYWLKLMFSKASVKNWTEYIYFGIFGLFNVAVLIALEKICKKLSYVLTNFENHRIQNTYERSLVLKLYGFTFFFNFSVFMFFSYIKGAFYTYPSDPRRWYFFWGFGVMACNPMGCLDEVWIMLMVTIFAKNIVVKLYIIIFKTRTDYNDNEDDFNVKYPCWEREYRLLPIKEETVIEKFRELVTQFGLITLFVAAFPLAPFLALLVNIWDVRYNAKLFLTGARRPLLTKSSGLGAWRDVLVVVSYFIALTNALTLSLTTKTVERFMYSRKFGTMYGFLNWTMSVFEVEDYLAEKGPGSPAEELSKYKGFIPKYCMYSGFRKPPPLPDKYMLEEEYWYFSYYHALFIIIFEHVVVCIVTVMHYTIPSDMRDIRDTQIIEERLKNTFMHRFDK